MNIFRILSKLRVQEENFSFEEITKDKIIQKENLFNLDTVYETLSQLDKNFWFVSISLFIIYISIKLRICLTRIITGYLQKVFSNIANKTQVEYNSFWVEKFQRPIRLFIPSITAHLLLLFTPIPEEEKSVLGTILYTINISLVLWIIFPAIDILTHFLTQITKRSRLPIQPFIPIIEKSIRVLIGMFGAIVIMDKLGVNTTGIFATLGIGGAALAFASKDTIANIYNAFTNKVDSLFKIDDWVQIGGYIEGRVVEIGLRSTKICTDTHTIQSIPNTVIAKEPIKRWDTMPKRRVKQILMLSHKTHSDTVVQIVEKIQKLLYSNEAVDPAFLLVNCVSLSGQSVDILIYYFTRNGEWSKYMETRQHINIEIMRILESHKVSLVPSRSIYSEEAPSSLKDVGNLPDDEGESFPD